MVRRRRSCSPDSGRQRRGTPTARRHDARGRRRARRWRRRRSSFASPSRPTRSATGSRSPAPTAERSPAGRSSSRGATLTRAVDAARAGLLRRRVARRRRSTPTPPAGRSCSASASRPATALPGQSTGGAAPQALGRWLSLAGFALGFGVAVRSAALGRDDRPLLAARLGRRDAADRRRARCAARPDRRRSRRRALVDPGFAEDVLLTRYGHLSALRLGGALGLWALAGAVRDSTRSRAPVGDPGSRRGRRARLRGLRPPNRTACRRRSRCSSSATHVAAFGAWLGCIVVALARVTRPATRAAGRARRRWSSS